MTSSFYHLQNNGKIERLQRTMNDILIKKIEGDEILWELYNNQMLEAIRFNVSESSKFSSFYYTL